MNPNQPTINTRAEQSRINGAKSHGPITEAGKCKINRNAMKHGFRSNHIPLATEDKEQYDQHLEAYLKRYSPQDKVEEDLVGLLASNMWQVMRINSVEVALFDLEISGIDQYIHGNYETMDQYGRLALAFRKSAGDNALELLRRYKSTAERAYHRALQALEEMTSNRAATVSEPSSPASSAEDKEPQTTDENEITVQSRARQPHEPAAVELVPRKDAGSETSPDRESQGDGSQRDGSQIS